MPPDAARSPTFGSQLLEKQRDRRHDASTRSSSPQGKLTTLIGPSGMTPPPLPFTKAANKPDAGGAAGTSLIGRATTGGPVCSLGGGRTLTGAVTALAAPRSCEWPAVLHGRRVSQRGRAGPSGCPRGLITWLETWMGTMFACSESTEKGPWGEYHRHAATLVMVISISQPSCPHRNLDGCAHVCRTTSYRQQPTAGHSHCYPGTRTKWVAALVTARVRRKGRGSTRLPSSLRLQRAVGASAQLPHLASPSPCQTQGTWGRRRRIRPPEKMWLPCFDCAPKASCMNPGPQPPGPRPPCSLRCWSRQGPCFFGSRRR